MSERDTLRADTNAAIEMWADRMDALRARAETAERDLASVSGLCEDWSATCASLRARLASAERVVEVVEAELGAGLPAAWPCFAITTALAAHRGGT